MSGHGEQPVEDNGDEQAAEKIMQLNLGETVYNEDGEELGEVRGFERGGFFVTTREGIESLSVEHSRAGHEYGEGELMWRCTECGEMGEIDMGVPDDCPNCGAPKEALMYWTED